MLTAFSPNRELWLPRTDFILIPTPHYLKNVTIFLLLRIDNCKQNGYNKSIIVGKLYPGVEVPKKSQKNFKNLSLFEKMETLIIQKAKNRSFVYVFEYLVKEGI